MTKENSALHHFNKIVVLLIIGFLGVGISSQSRGEGVTSAATASPKTEPKAEAKVEAKVSEGKVDPEHEGEVPAGLLRLGDGVFFPPFALVVDKSKKKIHVIDNSSGKPVNTETYDADLGKLSGDKKSTGDSRTPEGIYFLQKMLEGPGLDSYKYGVRAFTTDYPNTFDQRKKKTGYGIWLHAIDESQTLERGSQGCVVVRNDTIKKLSKSITLHETPLMVFDKIQWVPIDEAKKAADPVLKFVSQWKHAWETKDLDTYINLYAPDFRSKKMSRDKWKIYKADLAARYKDIKVAISMPAIYEHKDTLVVRFYQDYSSSDHIDFGEKTLYIIKGDGGYQIFGETWQEATDPKAKTYLTGDNLCCHQSTDSAAN